MKAFTIGRNENNDYKIDNNTVSGAHAELHIADDFKTFTLKDLNSTNGTSVNGQNIISKKIDEKQRIQLGTFSLESEELFSQLQAYILKNRTEFINEFHQLKEIEIKYNKEKQNVNKYFKLKSALFKGGITIGLMLLVYNNAYVKSIEGIRIYLMLGIGTIGGIISTASISDKKVKEKLEDLYIDFSETFHCPKCKFDMTSKSWRFWKSKKKCPKCKCNWIK
ncbi:FHA domain-containing protein [Polaribacter glomeratus]|uniref:FHA domain-containing protein n=1 Tax=Polaribacter glomeratus TaxID=102 RepID=A0A2S7WWV7_9FLAO|nr:FHA domain-containing protein [Polaribacter glomeratus]PQJ81861.1 hypothetical protein BTO16_04420 [Polaribacter glomeratus]TXD66215.1 FHA domain-containing protein [Polaribacter glomeratus]